MPILFNFKGDNQPNIEFSKTSGVGKTQHLKIAMKNDESKLLINVHGLLNEHV